MMPIAPVLAILAASVPGLALPVAPAPHQDDAPQPSAAAAATMGDFAGGVTIPKEISKILADPRLDPELAYMLWQLSRKPIGDWTMQELSLIGQIAPTIVEGGLPIQKLQILYIFWGLDPTDVFNPSLGQNWQSQSTAFSRNSADAVAAISLSDCQTDMSQMAVATFRACTGAAQ